MSTTMPIVLYVEDDQDSREVMSLILSEIMGCDSYHIFENSEDFLVRVNALEMKPTIIFLDIHMKPYSGFEMLEMLRKLDWATNVPIVALTASVMNEEVQMLKSAGFNSCLSKPIGLATFPDLFHQIVRGETIWKIFS